MPDLVGRTFGDALLAFEDSTLIGLRPAGGGPKLNPPMDTLIGAGDQVIVVSEDDDTVRLARHRAGRGRGGDPDRGAGRGRARSGRSSSAGTGARRRSSASSTATWPRARRSSSRPTSARRTWRSRSCKATLTNQSVRVIHADTTSRRVLDRLDVPSFDHIVVLCYADTLDAQRADSRTIITLLHLRDMEERGGLDFSIVSEMLDLRNRALAEVTNADDFIVSARLVSLLMAQVAENAALAELSRHYDAASPRPGPSADQPGADDEVVGVGDLGQRPVAAGRIEKSRPPRSSMSRRWRSVMMVWASSA